jgi:hypothetical protein
MPDQTVRPLIHIVFRQAPRIRAIRIPGPVIQHRRHIPVSIVAPAQLMRHLVRPPGRYPHRSQPAPPVVLVMLVVLRIVRVRDVEDLPRLDRTVPRRPVLKRLPHPMGVVVRQPARLRRIGERRAQPVRPVGEIVHPDAVHDPAQLPRRPLIRRRTHDVLALPRHRRRYPRLAPHRVPSVADHLPVRIRHRRDPPEIIARVARDVGLRHPVGDHRRLLVHRRAAAVLTVGSPRFPPSSLKIKNRASKSIASSFPKPLPKLISSFYGTSVGATPIWDPDLPKKEGRISRLNTIPGPQKCPSHWINVTSVGPTPIRKGRGQ